MNLLYLDTTVLCSAAYDIERAYHFLSYFSQFVLDEVFDDCFVSELPLEFSEYFFLRIRYHRLHQLVLAFYPLLLQVLVIPYLLQLVIEPMIVVISLLAQELSDFRLHSHLPPTHLLNYLALVFGKFSVRVTLLS